MGLTLKFLVIYLEIEETLTEEVFISQDKHHLEYTTIKKALVCCFYINFKIIKVRENVAICRNTSATILHSIFIYLRAAFAEVTTALNAAASFIAISARILRSSSMPLLLRPFINVE